jgi:tellurite resistance protein TerA
MGLFSKSTDATPPAPPAGATVSLTKGSRITLKKHTAERPSIQASNGWTAANKDYDLKALVRYRDGRLVYVGAANADEARATPERAVRHSGDVRSAGALETITITWHPDIAAVALSSYSALENGMGSFRKYGAFVTIKNGDEVVGLAAADASAKWSQYTLCFGEVLFGDDETFTVVNLEQYSGKHSENRIGYVGDVVTMDIGPKGKKK